MTGTHYVARKEGKRGLANIEVIVDASIRRLEYYIKRATTNNRTTITMKLKCEEKRKNRYFKRKTSEILQEMAWTCLRKGKKKLRESLNLF